MIEILGGIVAMDKYVCTDAESLAVSSLFSRASLKTVPDVSWLNFIFLQRWMLSNKESFIKKYNEIILFLFFILGNLIYFLK